MTLQHNEFVHIKYDYSILFRFSFSLSEYQFFSVTFIIFVSVKIAIERPTAGQYKQIRSFPVFVTKNVTKEISVQINYNYSIYQVSPPQPPEGVQSKRLIINDYRSFCFCVPALTIGRSRVKREYLRGNVYLFVYPVSRRVNRNANLLHKLHGRRISETDHRTAGNTRQIRLGIQTPLFVIPFVAISVAEYLI